MAGALKTLYGALAASQYMSGVSIVYGEEEVHDQSQALPMVVLVPTGGPYKDGNGYSAGISANVERIWGIDQSVDIYCWAWSSAVDATPIDHADAAEGVRQLVLSALQDQRAQYSDVSSVAYGLWFKPVSERWQAMQGAYTRYGRALVITVQAEISVPMAVGQEATITGYQIQTSFIAGP